MTDHEVFENRLRAALARHVAAPPTEFDALEFARTVAAAEPRRQGWGFSLSWPRVLLPRYFWIVLATVLLLTALAASALIIGSHTTPVPSSWQQIDLPVAAGVRAQMFDVVKTEGGSYLAVGDSRGSREPAGYVWTSSDGKAWNLVPTGETFKGAQLNAVIWTEDGYVAVGTVSWPYGRASVWRSADGRTWHAVASVARSGRESINDVVFTDGRYVAVGGEFIEAGYFDFIAKVWISDDAESWTLAAGDTWKATMAGELDAVAARGSELFALGRGRGLWTSPDGDTWTLLADPQANGPLSSSEAWPLDDVVVGRDGRIIVAGGLRGVAFSDDTVNWTREVLPDPVSQVPSGGDNTTTLVATSEGYAALWTGAMGTRPGLWTSSDGSTWTKRDMELGSWLDTSSPWAFPTLLSWDDALVVSAVNETWMLPAGSASAAPGP